MSRNIELFLLLNAPVVPGPAMLAAVRLLAESPVVIAPALLVWLWVRRPGPCRAGLLSTAVVVFAGQAVNFGLGLLWFEPRPFMAGIGHTLLAHAADNSFPSDHATLMFTLGAGLVLTGAARATGTMVCILGLGVGWARVWLGVHFPVDVLAAISVGVLAGELARLVQPGLRRHALPPTVRLYDGILALLRLPEAGFPRDAS